MTNNDKTKILDIIYSKISGKEKVIIGVDGLPGSGKSSFAASLSSKLKIDHLNCDLELNPSINCANLYSEKKLTYKIYQNDKIIVDGNLVQKLFQRIGLNPTVNLYIKMVKINQVTGNYEWVVIRNRKVRQVNSFDLGKSHQKNMEPLFKKVAEYHKKFKPEKNSIIVCNPFEAK